MDESLVRRLKDAIAEAFQPHRVLAAYAFGSRIHGRPRPDSDLDVGYYLEGHRGGAALSLEDEMRIAARLTEATGCGVDLRNLADAPLELRGRVLEEGVRIFSGNDVERVGLERDLLGRYHDYKETFRRMHELRLQRRADPDRE